MFSVLCAGIYGMYEKRFARKSAVTLCYFLTVGGFMALFMTVIAVMSFAREMIAGQGSPLFLLAVPPVGFVFGIIGAFFPWLTGLRNSGNDGRKE